jgi:glucose-6-phosphate 1-epimerase
MTNNARILALNQGLALPGGVQIVEGNGGLPKIQIQTAFAEAEIYLHGAQLTAWKPAGAAEVLFVSEKSHWEDGRAIRGGIPVCFPWFRAKADDPQAPAHGFVRTKQWRLESLTGEPDGAILAYLSTGSDETTRRWWPCDFRLEYRISVGTRLKLELTMKNLGQSVLRFEEALHTYFRVADVERVHVIGLDGAAFLDNRDGNRRKIQTGELRLSAQTDDAFVGAAGPVEIVDEVHGRRLKTEKGNSNTTIVWNPWRDGASAMTDFGSDEWRRMLCVEGGNILDSAVTIGPDEAHTMTIEISVATEMVH